MGGETLHKIKERIPLFIMRAYLINTKERSISEVDIEQGNIDKMQELIGCDLFTVASNFNFAENSDLADSLYVDDEGLLKADTPVFYFNPPPSGQYLAGNGLVLGVDFSTGESVSARISLAELEKLISWTDLSVK